MNLFRLSLANLALSPLSTAVNVLLLSLGTASIAILLIATYQLTTTLTRDSADIDLVIGAKGSPLQLVLAGVYHADIPPGNIALKEVKPWMEHNYVESATPLALGDNFQGYRIVGSTKDYIDIYGGKLGKGRLWEDKLEIVVGSNAANETGLDIGATFTGVHGMEDDGHAHEDQNYKVVGILEPTGTILDRLLVTSMDSVWALHETDHAGHDHGEEDHHDEHEHEDHADEHDHESEEHADEHGHDAHADEHDHEHKEHANDHDHKDHGHEHEADANKHDHEEHDHKHEEHADEHDHDDHDHEHEEHAEEHDHHDHGEHDTLDEDQDITVVLIKYSSPLAALSLPTEINSQSSLQAASPAAEVTRLLQIVGIGLGWLQAFAAILLLSAALSIFAALYASLKARRHDLAVLRCLGATRWELFLLLFVEGMALTIGGIVVGLLAAHGGLEIIGTWLSESQNVALTGFVWAPAEYGLVAGLLAAGFLTAIIPAWQAFSTDVARTLAKP